MSGGNTSLGPLFPNLYDIVWTILISVIGFGGLLLVAGIATVIVLATRRTKAARNN